MSFDVEFEGESVTNGKPKGHGKGRRPVADVLGEKAGSPLQQATHALRLIKAAEDRVQEVLSHLTPAARELVDAERNQ